MPYLKKPKMGKPLMSFWDRKTQKNGLRHTVFAPNGDKYTGEWQDNKRHGKGTQVWLKTGDIYDGDWKYGKCDGYGTYSKLNAEANQYVRLYCGGWKNGKKHGYGTHYYSESAIYEGEWKNDQRSGRGIMYYENGDIYDGEWSKDKHHGIGMIHVSNGNRYEGSWKDGKKNGDGTFLYQDRAQLYKGFWVDGIAKCGTLSNFCRDVKPNPSKYHIPKVQLLDAKSVLMQTKSFYTK